MLDILYKFLKKVVSHTYMLQWLETIIRAKFKGACIKASIIKSP